MSPRKKSCLLVPKGQKLRKLFKGGRVVTTWGSPPRLPPAGPCVRPAYACLPGGPGGCMWRSGGVGHRHFSAAPMAAGGGVANAVQIGCLGYIV